MKKFIIATFLIVLLLLSSCMYPTEAVVKTSVVTEIVSKTIVNTVTVVKVIDPITGNEYTIKKGEIGVANADARAIGYFNGYDAHWIGLVLNGEDTENQFAISVTPYSNADITSSPSNVADWVTVTNANLVDGTLTVSPMSAASLYITLNVPVEVHLPPQWGFLVHAVKSNGGNIVADDTIRWLVYMQQPS